MEGTLGYNDNGDSSAEDEKVPFARGPTEGAIGSRDHVERSDTSEVPEENRLGPWQAFFVLTGTFSGFSGLVLMTSLIYTGWAGFLIYLTVTAASAYSAALLWRCWIAVADKWGRDRRPYGAIAFEACGDWARVAVNFLVDAFSYGANAGMLLIISDLGYLLLGPLAEGTYCYWPVGFGLAVCPFLWLGSPKDNWLLSALSTLSCALAYLFLLINAATHIGWSGTTISPPDTTGRTVTGWNLSLVTGTAMFMMSVHFLIPTVQRDMKDPSLPSKCAPSAFAAITAMLIPTFAVVYFAFGDVVPKVLPSGVSILNVFPLDPLVVVTSTLLMIHSIMVVVPCVVPVLLHLEEFLEIPEVFCWRRVFLRTLVFLSVIFWAETLPQFSVLITLLSALTLPPLSFFAPALFYLRLRPVCPPGTSGTHRWRRAFDTAACIALMGMAPVMTVVASVVTVRAIANGETLFQSPCYVNATAAHP